MYTLVHQQCNVVADDDASASDDQLHRLSRSLAGWMLFFFSQVFSFSRFLQLLLSFVRLLCSALYEANSAKSILIGTEALSWLAVWQVEADTLLCGRGKNEEYGTSMPVCLPAFQHA